MVLDIPKNHLEDLPEASLQNTANKPANSNLSNENITNNIIMPNNPTLSNNDPPSDNFKKITKHASDSKAPLSTPIPGEPIRVKTPYPTYRYPYQ